VESTAAAASASDAASGRWLLRPGYPPRDSDRAQNRRSDRAARAVADSVPTVHFRRRATETLEIGRKAPDQHALHSMQPHVACSSAPAGKHRTLTVPRTTAAFQPLALRLIQRPTRATRSGRRAWSKSALVPPVRGGRCADPRSDRARSVELPNPRRPAPSLSLQATQTGQQPPQQHSQAPAPPRFGGSFRRSDHRATASARDTRPHNWCRTPRTGLDRRSSPVGPGHSAPPAAHRWRDRAFSAPYPPRAAEPRSSA
jgi:hypothetical protein